MLNLKSTNPIQRLQPLQKMIKTVKIFKKRTRQGLIPLHYYLLGGLLLPSITFASYAPMITNPSNGYTVNLNNNTSISTSPYIGSDGQKYYQIGEPISLQNIAAKGSVRCIGKSWGDVSSHQLGEVAYHKIFIYPSLASVVINNSKVYIINNNVLMAIDSSLGEWILLDQSVGCSNPPTSGHTTAVAGFVTPKQIKLTFYMKDNIIDGKVVIPAMDLAGYVRAFVKPLVTPEFSSWPIGESTAPVRILPSVINVDSSCNATLNEGQANTINLRHNPLSTLSYDSVVTEKVTYSCKFSIPTKARLRLDYVTDSDPQKRLPMISRQNSNDRIYSELTLTDEATGQTGKELKVDIKDIKTVKISSRIQGNNAAAGEYQGSAWLIATFD